MKWDWVWAWLAALPALVIGLVATMRSGLVPEGQPWTAVGLSFAVAALISTAILWLMNKRSIRKLTEAGREIELVVRPVDAIGRAVVTFPAIFGLFVLLQLVLDDWSTPWGEILVLSGALSYMYGLDATAYKKDD